MFIDDRGEFTNIGDLYYDEFYIILIPLPLIGVNGWNAKGFIILEVYYKYICSAIAELFAACITLILVTFSLIVVSLPLFSGRSLFRIRKLVKYLFKLYLFTTQSNIALSNFLGVSVKSTNYN